MFNPIDMNGNGINPLPFFVGDNIIHKNGGLYVITGRYIVMEDYLYTLKLISSPDGYYKDILLFNQPQSNILHKIEKI